MKIPGVGVSALSWVAQLAVSAETKVVSFVCGASLAAWGVRREIVSTVLTAGFLRRLVRMWDPCCLFSGGLRLVMGDRDGREWVWTYHHACASNQCDVGHV